MDNSGHQISSSSIPPKVLVKLNALSNIDFVKLTRSILKERVKEIKDDLEVEFNKLKNGDNCSADSSASGPPVTNKSNNNHNGRRDDPINSRSNPHVHSSKKEQPSLSNTSSGDKNKIRPDSKGPNDKSTGGRSDLPSKKPSYAELLKLAQSGLRNSESPKHPVPDDKRDSQSSVRDRNSGGGGNSRSAQNSRHSDLHPVVAESRKATLHRSHRDSNRNGHPDGNGGHHKTSPESSRNSKSSVSVSTRSPLDKPNGPPKSRRDDYNNNRDTRDMNHQKPVKEKQPRRNRKAEEDAFEERRRQKLRQEEERVKLRNDGMFCLLNPDMCN